MAKVYLSIMKREDVQKMVQWGKHEDPRFFHYNFNITTENGFDLWYKSKRKVFYRKIYKVENEDQMMVGFITIKNINWFTKTAEMGIVFDPNHLNEGYGTAGMQLILKEFFEVLNMSRLYLRVASFNERAFHAYLNAGFEIYNEKIEAFENQQLVELLAKRHEDMDLIDGVLYADYTYMHVTKGMYMDKLKSER